ncbi:Gelsolin-like protein 1 [Aphelenchoides bicaudatus]|nr:Gelsolin-like protein 1 [Aphelenchoides bicaudatus]
MPAVDPKFKSAGRTRGLEIWRVNKFDLEVVPKEQFGNFFSGDAYIVLSTRSNDNWDVHFWLGKQCTQDEQGTAAIKTVELDDSLGGLPVQYREIQDHESPLFLSYFKNGIKYLQGGYASGFEHVVSEYKDWKPKLFHCKGKRNVRVSQVDCSLSSLNLGDVFILDQGLELYVWMPPKAGRLERVKGVNQAKNIRDQERAGRPKVTVLDQDWNTNPTFWKVFGGTEKVKQVKSAEAGGKDENFWRQNRQNITLYRVSDASGKLQITKIHQGGLNPKLLETNDAFIVDAVNGGVYVWIGKGCTMEERKKAQEYGKEYIKQQKRPAHTQIIRVLESAEPDCFRQWFTEWQGQLKGSKFEPKLFNVSNETGKLIVEEVANFTQSDLDVDDVMILDNLNVIYVWIGSGAEQAERDAAEKTAKKYLETDGIPRKKADIEILYQGKENPGFKKLFGKWDEKIWAKQEIDHKNLSKMLFRKDSGANSLPMLFAS